MTGTKIAGGDERREGPEERSGFPTTETAGDGVDETAVVTVA